MDRKSTSSHDDIMDILDAHEADSNHYDDGDYAGDEDDDGMMFADDSERQKLEIEVDVDAVTANHQNAATTTPVARSPLKRRRSSTSNGASSLHGKRSKVLSITNMLELWNQLSENQQKFELAQLSLKRIQDNITAVPNDALANLVGDALQHAVKQNDADLRSMAVQKRILHALANERRALGLEAMRYLPWLEAALQHDEEDLAFCAVLEEKIGQFQPIHAELKKMRAIIREEEARKAELEAERERKRKEAEENERFRRAALAMETEAKPGMVWNPTTREYQALNTDESWRD